MKKATALQGVLQERSALQEPGGIFSPTYISEHMQRLAQYTSSLEESLAELEATKARKEAELFTKYREEGKTVNASQVQIEYDTASERAEIVHLSKLCRTSWRLISVSQSRINHLLAEAKNQV